MRLFFQKKIYCKLKIEINFFEAIQNFIRKEYRQRKHFVEIHQRSSKRTDSERHSSQGNHSSAPV